MKRPKLSGSEFLSDVVHARKSAPSSVHVWWIGQSGFLVSHEGRNLLIDPYLSDSLTRKYAETDKPHVRMTELVIEPGRLASAAIIHLVTSSHNHTDHLDPETLLPLKEANPEMEILVSAANRDFVAERLGCPATELRQLDAGDRVELSGVEIHAVPAAHEDLDRDEEGRHPYLGYVFGVGGRTIYHSGDTLLYDGMVDALKPFAVDVALLPINGRAPERRVAGNLDSEQAAALAHDIGAGLVIPCHYDMFEFNTATPESFVEACERLGQRYRVLENGERLTL